MKNATMTGVVVLAMFAAPALAQSTKSHTTTKQMSDLEFVIDAGNASLAEIELGKLAETRASNDEVKTFAKRMVDDHQKALDSLKTIAITERITLPTTLDRTDQALKDRLEKLSGHAFDQAYISAMVRDHRNDVTEFRAESKNAKAADVKQYASNTLPTLEDHLKLAQSADKAITGTSSTAAVSKKPVG